MTGGLSMRAEVARALGSLAIAVPELVCVSADGQFIFKDFINQAPTRHVDVGIAEATLVGVAAGIARCGRPVVISSIASFLLRRAYEQIVVDVAMDRLPVVMLGLGGGLAYGALGATHHVPEDFALARLAPGVNVFAPADAPSAAEALRLAVGLRQPAYIRIGSAEDPLLPPCHAAAGLRPRMLRDGDDITVVASGACVHEALAAAADLAVHGVGARVLDVMCLHPWPDHELRGLLLAGRPVLVVEEHVRDGGLGTLVGDHLAGEPFTGFARCLVPGFDGLDRR